jgi:hypothetical protein
VAALGGAPGFVRVEGPRALRLPLPDAGAPREWAGAALLFFVPGLGETLRANGRARVHENGLAFELQEAFGHCAKALIRSAFWQRARGEAVERGEGALGDGGEAGPRAPGPLAAPAVADFLAHSPFLVFGSGDGAGASDASPRGDPAGFARILDADTLALPERRGNRRTDTLHNLLARPDAALLALVPGDPRALELVGRARLTREPSLLARMAVAGKAPKLAVLLRVARAELAVCPALAASGLWDPARHPSLDGLPPMARVFADHVRRSRQRGVAATAIRALTSERWLAPMLQRDYEDGLY